MGVALKVVDILQKGHRATKRDMLSRLASIKKIAYEFETLEKNVLEGLHKDVKLVLQNKRLVLFEHLVKKSGIIDEEFFIKLKEGFPLTGHVGPTGRWFKEVRPALMSQEEHDKSAPWLRESVLGKCKSAALEEEALTELLKVTDEEVGADFLDGPYSVESALDMAGPHTTFARRFVIKQKDKWRPIDDFTISRVNMRLSTVEKARVDSLDDYLAKARFLLEAARSARCNGTVLLPDGNRIQVDLHTDWLESGALEVRGRCLDLSNAYKQFPVNPLKKRYTAIAVPKGYGVEPSIYFTRVLPFGATASVYYFLRFSEMLKYVLLDSLGVICSCYFDDFPCVTFGALSSVTQFATEGCLDLLGFEFSRKEHKRLPFDRSFRMLGVVVTFPHPGEDMILVGNTSERKAEVQATVANIIERKILTQAECASLLGRLSFLSSQVWSRVGQVLIGALRRRSMGSDTSSTLDADLEDCLRAAVALLSAPPRTLAIVPRRRTTWIFTDAACEPSMEGCVCSTLGGVLLDDAGCPARFYSCEVPRPVTDLWADSSQPITYAESLAALVAKMLWGQFLVSTYPVIAVDNVGAQNSLSRYSSRSKELSAIIRAHVIQDALLGIKCWITWVPSESNVADLPSRMNSGELRRCSVPEDMVSSEHWDEVVRRLNLNSADAALEFVQALSH